MTYRRALACEDLWPGEMRGCRAGAERVLLVNLAGEVRAYRDRCAHLGVPLSEGELRDGVLRCRAHGWQYDAATGRGVNPASAALEPLPVRVEDGFILVRAEGDTP